MRLAGLACTLGGWLLAVAGLLITTAVAGRLVFACLGIGLALFGSLVVLNGYYLARAIWKR